MDNNITRAGKVIVAFGGNLAREIKPPGIKIPIPNDSMLSDEEWERSYNDMIRLGYPIGQVICGEPEPISHGIKYSGICKVTSEGRQEQWRNKAFKRSRRKKGK